LFQRALRITEHALGSDDPDTATSLLNLGVLYRYMGDYAKAEPLHLRALSIREQALGRDHPHVAGALNNLAALYRARCEYAKAEPCYLRAVKIREKVSDTSPDTASTLMSLGALHDNLGDQTGAEEF